MKFIPLICVADSLLSFAQMWEIFLGKVSIGDCIALRQGEIEIYVEDRWELNGKIIAEFSSIGFPIRRSAVQIHLAEASGYFYNIDSFLNANPLKLNLEYIKENDTVIQRLKGETDGDECAEILSFDLDNYKSNYQIPL